MGVFENFDPIKTFQKICLSGNYVTRQPERAHLGCDAWFKMSLKTQNSSETSEVWIFVSTSFPLLFATEVTPIFKILFLEVLL